MCGHTHRRHVSLRHNQPKTTTTWHISLVIIIKLMRRGSKESSLCLFSNLGKNLEVLTSHFCLCWYKFIFHGRLPEGCELFVMTISLSLCDDYQPKLNRGKWQNWIKLKSREISISLKCSQEVIKKLYRLSSREIAKMKMWVGSSLLLVSEPQICWQLSAAYFS